MAKPQETSESGHEPCQSAQSAMMGERKVRLCRVPRLKTWGTASFPELAETGVFKNGPFFSGHKRVAPRSSRSWGENRGPQTKKTRFFGGHGDEKRGAQPRFFCKVRLRPLPRLETWGTASTFVPPELRRGECTNRS